MGRLVLPLQAVVVLQALTQRTAAQFGLEHQLHPLRLVMIPLAHPHRRRYYRHLVAD
jgi:hypothetical protein